MTTIKRQDFVDSIADALQYISVYHPVDFIRAMAQAYEREINPAAKNAIAQILTSSRMAALARRPVCQDTGVAVVFLKIGMQVRWDSDEGIQAMVDSAVSRARERQAVMAVLRPDSATSRRPATTRRRSTGCSTRGSRRARLQRSTHRRTR